MKEEILHRFSDRVDNYMKYRPVYPEEIFYFLEEAGVFKKNETVADIGSGTGISALPLLKRHYPVFGIEPNKEMREAGERFLHAYPDFKSINGTAENTGLSAHSIQSIVAGQAFHWFEKEKTKAEWKRILMPGGFVVLMWNDRRTDNTDFLKVYEDFLQMFGTDYKEVNHKNTQDTRVFDSFFGKGNYAEKGFYNLQEVDFEGLKGRVLSSSYMPNEGHKDFDFMISCLKKIFLRYQEKGLVKLEYDTRIYYGQLN